MDSGPQGARGNSAALLRWAAGVIGGETARLDAEVLLAHALGTERFALLAAPRAVGAEARAAFAAMVARRVAGEPVAYVVGHRDFWTLRLRVGPGVLVPRPDSETLIEAAADALTGRDVRRVLDLGTGSGALLLAALDVWRGAVGVGVDRSAVALGYALANAADAGMGARVGLVRGDWAAGVGGRFDLVLCNPPYVEAGAALPADVLREPGEALFAGADGLDCYRVIVPGLAGLLAPGGVAVLEVGAGQAAAVAAMWPGGFAGTRRDLGGHARAVVFGALGKGAANG